MEQPKQNSRWAMMPASRLAVLHAEALKVIAEARRMQKRMREIDAIQAVLEAEAKNG